MLELNKLYNMDCMEGMKEFPDKYFELAIVDPPYGIGQDWKKRNNCNKFIETSYKNDSIPDEKYFNELKRVSKDQIIWGYNYYVDYIGSTNYLIVWDKVSNNNQVFHYSKAEIAYTTKRIPCNLVSIPWDGYRMGKETGTKKIHPHQKPIELYLWILQNYAKQGDKILDTHAGSCSSLIACYNYKFDFIGFEIDKDYYESAQKRMNAVMAQVSLFDAI
jgi:site-specific DNA-methyltransferase (adenine-specific)